jgi:hypothetical protein
MSGTLLPGERRRRHACRPRTAYECRTRRWLFLQLAGAQPVSSRRHIQLGQVGTAELQLVTWVTGKRTSSSCTPAGE